MKITRNFSSRIISRVSTALLALCTMSANAQQSVQSGIITFSASEELHAENAAQILTDRLHLNKGTDELHSVYIEQPGDGLQVQRFNQYFKGIRVAHGTYTLTSKNGIAAYAFGKFYPTSAVLATAPQLSEATALSSAVSAIRAEKYAWEDNAAEYPKGTLTYTEDYTDGNGDGMLHLAYVFDIYAIQPLSRTMVYVDAQSGKIIFMDAVLKHINATGASLYSDTVTFQARKVSNLYYLHDTTRGSGIYTYNLNHSTSTSSFLENTSTTSVFAQDPAVDAHWGAKIVYDYWKNTHNRLSWNGANGVLKSYVHYSTAYNNAMWNGSAMVYGDGSGVAGGGFSPLTALDICGHEIGHGVCQSTAGLVYSKESGAMNEGFSDIWGAVIEAYGDPHEADAIPKNPWLVGEELTNTLRSMSNPKQFRQPNTYLGTNWVYTGPGCLTSNDNCGVHTNSGVLNYWFYLLTAGGKGTNDLDAQYQVAGIGMTKSAKIAYATELALNSTATYASCRTASIAAATTLYGACSPEAEAVTRAWYAVGVGSNFTPCTPQISFTAPTTTVAENASADGCHPSHVVSVPVMLSGPALSGGNATVTVSIIGGNAIAGVDYDFTASTATFTPGGSTTQSIALTVYDNGAITADKYIDFIYTLSAGSSNATRSSVLDTMRVFISDDDHGPDAGIPTLQSLLTGNTTGINSSPFFSSASGARVQYIYKAQELLAAGLRPNVPFNAAEFFITAKSSTQAFSGFTMKLANTPATSLAGGFVSALFTQVYSANVTTTASWNTLLFSAPFTWNGTDNLAVEICFNNSSAGTANDNIRAQLSPFTLAAYASTTTGASGCSLAFNVNNLVGSRPVIHFSQDTPPLPVETAVNSTRTWDVKAILETYFYSAGNNKIIAGILNPVTDMGCVTATVTVAGNGFIPASGGSRRSVKEFSLTRTQPDTTGSFDAIFYLSNVELGGANPDALRIVQTTSIDDYHLQPGNTNIVTPEIFYGADFMGFRGTFTGTQRFYLTEGNPALAVNGTVAKADELWTGANPFQIAPVLHWNLSVAERVSIRLYDVTGKLVYGAEQTLAAGRHQVAVSGNTDFAPGAYVLQVVRPSGVFTRQLVKQ